MRDYYQTAKEEKRRRRKIKVRLYIILLFLVLCCVGAVFFLRSSFFSIQTININNENTSLAHEVKASFSKILSEKNTLLKKVLGENNIVIPWLEHESLTASIVAQLPALKTLSIDPSLFGKTITFKFEERQQFGLWCIPQEEHEQCWWFDKDGILFSQGPQTTGTLINKVTDTSGYPLQTGSSIFEDARYKESLIKIFSFLHQTNIRINHLVLKNRTLAEVETAHPTHPIIYFSLRTDPSFALQSIKELEKKFDSLQYIDLRVQNRVYYK